MPTQAAGRLDKKGHCLTLWGRLATHSLAPYLIRSACLTGYAELARAVGIDPRAMLREVFLDREYLADRELKIPTASVIRLFEISAVAAGIEDFGLRLSETRHPSNLGPVALAVRDASTLREALEAAVRYIPLHNEGMSLSLEPFGELTIFRIEDVTNSYTPNRHSIELAVAIAHRLIRHLLGDARRSLAVCFAHGAPNNLSTHIRVFGSHVDFGRETHGIVLEDSDLDAPLPGGDAVMATHVRRYLEPMLAESNPSTSAKVRRLVYDLLASRRASADQIAGYLGLHRRTLFRELAKDGFTYSSIVTDVRSDLARRYLADRQLSLNDVGRLLGFSEASAFSRWFRTEFDCTPLAWRAAANQPDAKTLV
jgi:AraC-like DNA-binding protein